MGILVGMLGLAAREMSLRLFNDKWKDRLKPYVKVVTIICIILNITALILSIMYFRGNW